MPSATPMARGVFFNYVSPKIEPARALELNLSLIIIKRANISTLILLIIRYPTRYLKHSSAVQKRRAPGALPSPQSPVPPHPPGPPAALHSLPPDTFRPDTR